MSSSFAHGSQGALWDIFEPAPVGQPWPLHRRSLRNTRFHVLRYVVSHLIEAVHGEELHRGRDLAADMYQRELDLITEDW